MKLESKSRGAAETHLAQICPPGRGGPAARCSWENSTKVTTRRIGFAHKHTTGHTRTIQAEVRFATTAVFLQVPGARRDAHSNSQVRAECCWSANIVQCCQNKSTTQDRTSCCHERTMHCESKCSIKAMKPLCVIKACYSSLPFPQAAQTNNIRANGRVPLHTGHQFAPQ